MKAHTPRRMAVFALLVLASIAAAQTRTATAEQRTAQYMDTIRGNVPLLTVFLRAMPKGADLHNHLSGSVYAESLLQWGIDAGECVNLQTLQATKPPCQGSAGNVPLSATTDDPVLYRQIIDAWSMRNWQITGQSGHDHFFDSFGKFGVTTDNRTGEMLAEVAARAAANHEQYQELMFNPVDLREVIRKTGWIDDSDKMREALLANGLREAMDKGNRDIAAAEARRDAVLQCASDSPQPGCRVVQRYLFQVARGQPRETVFAQILAGFEMASQDGHVVGFNLVMPEDYLVPMRDYELHMRMIDALKKHYPKVHISLHAGELAPGLVPPEGLRFHIRQAVEIGHAERIGHGVDIAHEDRPDDLLRDMAKRNVMVEINLTSNDVILGIKGRDHPLATYLKYGVPVALSTDDEGVARSDLTMEYLRGVLDQSLSYSQLKHMARTSLEHAFIRGESLWNNPSGFTPVKPCASDSSECRNFLAGSEKARLQWELEKELADFEKQW